MIPTSCPSCGAQLVPGFVNAEGGLVMWTRVNPAEESPNPRDIVYLQRKPEVRSFRLSALEPPPVPAVRCDACKLVIVDYSEATE